MFSFYLFLPDHLRCPPQVKQLMRDCWLSDPTQRPSFEETVDCLSAYIGRVERTSYEARARIDSGVGSRYEMVITTYKRVHSNIIIPVAGLSPVPII